MKDNNNNMDAEKSTAWSAFVNHGWQAYPRMGKALMLAGDLDEADEAFRLGIVEVRPAMGGGGGSLGRRLCGMRAEKEGGLLLYATQGSRSQREKIRKRSCSE